ncbi:MAG TPA: carbohydrate porin [Rhodanobacteraceae bacterium]|nr:carbohydrate porin [Rhodanobacteraceae bacterium]
MHKSVSRLTARALACGFALASTSAFAATTEVGGKLFFDVSHRTVEASHGDGAGRRGSGGDVKRMYFTLAHAFNPVWSLHLTTDAAWSSADGFDEPFVKKAYLQTVFSKSAVLRLGAADLPWVSYVDKAQGFRYVEKSLLDRLKFGTSADWGVHLGGGVGAGTAVNYAVSAVNGRGYREPGHSHHVDVEARVAVEPVGGLALAIGAYSGKLGAARQAATYHTAQRTSVMLAWTNAHLRVGAEWFRADNWRTVAAPLSDTAAGWSAWASARLADQWAVFGRHDRARLRRDRDPRNQQRYSHAGVEYQVSKRIDLALVWKRTHSDASALCGTQACQRQQRSDEIGVWGQLAF